MCGVAGRPCLPSEALEPEFATLVARYRFGRLEDLLRDPCETVPQSPSQSSPIDTLAHRIQEDGLLVFAPAVTIDVRNAFLDAVRSQEDCVACPAAGNWRPSGMGQSDNNWLKPNAAGGWIDWLVFEQIVKRKKRFVLNFEAGDIPNFPALFREQIPALCGSIAAGTKFYRARKHDSSIKSDIPTNAEMGPPPSENAKAGRANASGISVLYVGNTERTVISEVRPHVGAVVHLARCRAKTELRVFDLTTYRPVQGLDPFSPEFESRVKNASTLAILNDEFAKPIEPHTPDRDYAPTQYVAELIGSSGYDGIKYRSALASDGVNYVFFAPKKFEIRYERSVRVTRLEAAWESYSPGFGGLLQQA